MNNEIEAILFDMGGTLSSTSEKSKAEQLDLTLRIRDLLGVQENFDEFFVSLTSRAAAYKRWADETLVELNERDLWTKWMLPDWPADQISEIAIQLNQLYRDISGTQIVFQETREIILELFRRGYRLGLVSNITNSIGVFTALKEMHLTGCFETVVLSATFGKRKPDPAILLEATRRMDVTPGKCAYIGNRVDRDVAAARNAGFSKAIIIRDQRSMDPENGHHPVLVPDGIITSLSGLFEIFPPCPSPQPATIYNASLSTMWALKNFPTMADFFEAARRMGFARIELNHKITTSMLQGIDLSKFNFSSVHEPCPADVSEDELKKRDWLISSKDETCRLEGVKAIKRSIDIAKRIGAGTVVIHAGHSTLDKDKLEKKLRTLIDAGQNTTNECKAIYTQIINLRADNAAASFEAVKKSMLELLDYARPIGIRLGLENRYHYLEHPSPDELDILLDLSRSEQIGFIYDLGHAEALSRLGFYPKDEWLIRFSPRIIGTHLHDVVGTSDHYAPGRGDADFDALAAIVPKNAFRTCEFQSFNTPEDVRSGLKFLVEHGCIEIH